MFADRFQHLLERGDDVIGGVWGNHITWMGEFGTLANGSKHRAYAHKPHDQRQGLKMGAKIVGEFTRSWVMFEVVQVRECANPPDMVFLTLTPLEQIPKGQG